MSNLRELPKVDSLAASPSLSEFSAAVRSQAARAAISAMRIQAKNGAPVDPLAAEALALEEAWRLQDPGLKRVLNATGVILHTGLGRARLAEAAAKRVLEAANHHVAVEIDLESGDRGDRQAPVRRLLCEITGAEDAHVVNNGAAAVLLALAAIARGREVILSRGEMVEIGGSFRMPEVIAESGCRLIEVGCTNKTRISDYKSAIGEETGALLRCHPSNYRIVGFAESPSDRDLARIAKEHGIPFIYDLGNGNLAPHDTPGLPAEASLAGALADGADVVTASGDKLLGGPQAGLIVGSRELVPRMRGHPLARALRVDKLTLAGLEATLRLHREGRLAEIPTYRYLARPLDSLRRDARTLARAYAGKSVVERAESEVGGGSAPGSRIPTWRAGLLASKPDELSRRLRLATPALIGRIERGIVWLDPRTLEPAEVREAARILREVADE